MGVSRRTRARRLITVLAVVLLAAFGWGGAASAQVNIPITTTPPVSTTTTSSSAGTTTTTTSGSALGLPGLGGLFPTGTTGLPSIPGLPSIDPSSSPSVACAQVVSALRGLDATDLSSALDSPAAIFCQSLGFTLPTLPGADQSGTAVETTFPTTTTSDSYDDGFGRRYYGSCGCTTDATPVYATQVSSVPTGGVNTGDGSYEGP